MKPTPLIQCIRHLKTVLKLIPAVFNVRSDARKCVADGLAKVGTSHGLAMAEARRYATMPPPDVYFSPDIRIRLLDCRERLNRCDAFRAQCDRLHDKLSKLNPAVTATAEGEAWHAVAARADVLRTFTLREIDALLDGDLAEADSAKRAAEAVDYAIERHLPELEAAIAEL